MYLSSFGGVCMHLFYIVTGGYMSKNVTLYYSLLQGVYVQNVTLYHMLLEVG